MQNELTGRINRMAAMIRFLPGGGPENRPDNHFLTPAGAEIWIDGGHNPGAGEVIAEAMATFEERQSRPLFLIIGM
ncbi:hypothetical protein HFO52_35075, partial [Rhizobium leguminosarum]|nr:hypothetical protein [Rhizobium leguminosarum]